MRVVALVETASGFQMPLLTTPDRRGLAAHVSPAERALLPQLKGLRHALSEPLGEDGIASFPLLYWTSEGRADRGLTRG